jgi:NAD-dependent SIR2 family protein deacetylase
MTMITRSDEFTEAMRIIRNAVNAERPLLPFLGAGISVAAGLPTIQTLSEYLAKVKYYIDNDVYCAILRELKDDLGTSAYRQNPSTYLDQFGWPDLHQLDSDLWHYLCHQTRQDPAGAGPASFGAGATPAPRHTELNTLVQEEFRKSLHERGQDALADFLLNLKANVELRGDWVSFLMRLTEGKVDFIDSLFLSLTRRRQPTTNHVFLTHLAKVLRVNLLWTINFDSLLEASMQAEGVPPQIFDVFRDAALPHKSLVVKQRSLVKAHGSAYGLRTGERLEYALDEENRKRALELIPENALIVVLGFSGNERRMMNLLGAAVDRYRGDAPAILWLYYDAPSKAVGELEDRFDPGLVVCRRIEDTALFVKHALTEMTDTFPLSRQPYDATQFRLIPNDFSSPHTTPPLPAEPLPITIFANISTSPTSQTRSPSLDLSEYVGALERQNYRSVWINLERHATVEGLVNEILFQLHTYDPGTQPILFPCTQIAQSPSPEPNEFSRVVRRIHSALRRGKYVIAFDKLEAFARPPTTHHGYPSFSDQTIDGQTRSRERIMSNFNRLRGFISELACVAPPDARNQLSEQSFGDSRLCFAIDLPSARHVHLSHGNVSGNIQLALEDLVAQLSHRGHALPGSHDPSTNIPCPVPSLPRRAAFLLRPRLTDRTGDAEAWLLSAVCTLRCPFHRMIVRALIEDFLPRDNDDASRWLNATLARLHDLKACFQMPGSYHWIVPRPHEARYKELTQDVHWALIGGEPEDDGIAAFIGATLVSGIHLRAARYYYTAAYLPSQDVHAFLEYVYHRIASLKYLLALCRSMLKLQTKIAVSWESLTSAVRSVAGEKPDDTTAVGVHFLELFLESSGAGDAAVSAVENAPARLTSPLSFINSRRLFALRMLNSTLARERERVMSLARPGTWLAWIDQILAYEIPHLTLNPEALAGLPNAVATEERGILNEASVLRETLLDQRATLLRERGDFDECIRSRLDQIQTLIRRIQDDGGAGAACRIADLLAVNSEATQRKLGSDWDSDPGILGACFGSSHSVSTSRTERLDSAMLNIWNWTLDMVRCLAYLHKYDSARFLLHRLRRRCKAMQISIESTHVDNMSAVGSYDMTALRCDATLSIASIYDVLIRVGFSDIWDEYHYCPITSGQHSLEAANARAAEANELARKYEELAKGSRYVGQQLYFLHRGQLQLLRARALCWLGDKKNAEHQLNMADVSFQSANPSSTRIFRAIAELCRADMHLLALRTDGEETEPNRVDRATRLQKRERLLKEADERLEAAEELLLRYRRDVFWWHALCVRRTRCAIEALCTKREACRVVEELNNEKLIKFFVEVDHIARSGLSAIIAGFDSIFHPWRIPGSTSATSDFTRTHYKRLVHMWVQMATFYFLSTKAAYYLLRDPAPSRQGASRRPSHTSGSRQGGRPDYSTDLRRMEFVSVGKVWVRWRELNQMAGFEPLIGEQASGVMQELFYSLDAQYGDLRASARPSLVTETREICKRCVAPSDSLVEILKTYYSPQTPRA